MSRGSFVSVKMCGRWSRERQRLSPGPQLGQDAVWALTALPEDSEPAVMVVPVRAAASVAPVSVAPAVSEGTLSINITCINFS